MRLASRTATMSGQRLLAKAVVSLLLLAGAVTMIIPFVWMLSSSLSTLANMQHIPPRWFAHPLKPENYVEVFRHIPFFRMFLNSLEITTLSTIGALLSCSMAGFSVARLRFQGRDLVFMVLLGTMMIPYVVVLVPQFIIFKTLHWVDTHLPLIVPAFLAGPFGTFLFRQFFRTLPPELDDAARIDGCGPFRIYANIALPLAKPVLAAMAVISFQGSWNDFLAPLIYLYSPEKQTVAVGLAYLRQLPPLGTDWNIVMAASLMSIIPTVIVFVAAQDYFVQGVVMSGIKG
ncbi:MAG: carbohydrate ABC transporter permease [Anaerolineae bacterium]